MLANSLDVEEDNHVECFTSYFLDKRVSQLLVAEPEADVHRDKELGIGRRLNFSEFHRSICHEDTQPYDKYAIWGDITPWRRWKPTRRGIMGSDNYTRCIDQWSRVSMAHSRP